MMSLPQRLQQMAVGSMTTYESASKMMGGSGSKLDSAASATSATFSWNHNAHNIDHWTAVVSDDTDNASTMAAFPLCVNINDDYQQHHHHHQYQQQHHHLQYSPHDGCCPVMIWKILRFVKLVVVRLAHSYYAQRIILFILPLFLGLLVGFLWGRCCGSHHNRHKNNNSASCTVPTRKSQSKSSSSSSSFPYFTASLWHVVLPVVNSVYRLLLKFHQPENSSSELQAEEESPNSIIASSGLDKDSIPRHVAIIMDGNRRYGRAKYQNATRGHRDGANQVLQVTKWCIAEEHIQVLTLYAFSTENWNRDPAEIAAIMNMFVEECDNVRRQAIQLNVRAYVVSSDPTLIPSHVAQGLQRLQEDTAHCTGLQLNICVSYGSRSEIVNACRQVVQDVQDGHLSKCQISEETFARRLLTNHHGVNIVDPDILIRTSGETRISNYLLWQIAYAELFFVPQTWPELTHVNFTNILQSYAKERQRRFGR